MRLRCRHYQESPDGVRDLTMYARPDKNDYDLSIGQEYVAMGLGFWDDEVWIEIATEGGFLMSVPLNRFDVVNGTASAFWELRQVDGGVRLWPSSFYQGAYHSDLADRVPEIVADFEDIRERLEAEDRRHLRRLR